MAMVWKCLQQSGRLHVSLRIRVAKAIQEALDDVALCYKEGAFYGARNTVTRLVVFCTRLKSALMVANFLDQNVDVGCHRPEPPAGWG